MSNAIRRRSLVLMPVPVSAGCAAVGVVPGLATTGATTLPFEVVVPDPGRLPAGAPRAPELPPPDVDPGLEVVAEPPPRDDEDEPAPVPTGGAADPRPPPDSTERVPAPGALKTTRSNGPGRISRERRPVVASLLTSANSTDVPLRAPGTQALASYAGTRDHGPCPVDVH